MSKMALELDDAAEVEFYDIVDYYKQFDPELSYDFIQEFEDAVQRLIKFPKAGHPYLHQTKRIFLRVERFVTSPTDPDERDYRIRFLCLWFR